MMLIPYDLGHAVTAPSPWVGSRVSLLPNSSAGKLLPDAKLSPSPMTKAKLSYAVGPPWPHPPGWVESVPPANQQCREAAA